MFDSIKNWFYEIGIKKALGTLVRHGITGAGVYLATHVPKFNECLQTSQEEITLAVTTGVGAFLVGILMSFAEKAKKK